MGSLFDLAANKPCVKGTPLLYIRTSLRWKSAKSLDYFSLPRRTEPMNAPLRRSVSLPRLAVGAAGVVGMIALATGHAQASQLPHGVLVQCTDFSGPVATDSPTLVLDPVAGCISRGQTGGSGAVYRDDTNGIHTLVFDRPFEGGKSLDLGTITSTVLSIGNNACPAASPVEVAVSGTVVPRSPYAGAQLTATICTGPSRSFSEEPGTFFTITR